MSLKDYLRASAFDFLLCLVVGMGLGFINCGAFFVDASLQCSWPALIIATAVPLLLFFAAAYSTRTVVPGAVGIAVLLALAVVASAGISGNANVLEDQSSNPAIFILVMFLSTAVAFLLTRKRWMARCFFLVAVLDIAFVEFMYKDGHWFAMLAVIVAAGAMAVYRNYRSNLRDASSTTVSFTSAFALGAGASVILGGIACVLFFGVIAPLNPPAKEIKIFTHYVNYETVEMTGVGDSSITKDPDKASGTTKDQTQKSKDDPENSDDDKDVETNMSPLNALNPGSLSDLSDQGQSTLAQMLNYLMANPPYFVLLILLVLLVLVSPFAIKLWTRRRWYAKTCELPPGQAVERFFVFFMKRFKILKIRKRGDQTLADFVEGSKWQLAPFAEANQEQVEFAQVADAYSKVVYGKTEPTQDELDAVKGFYAGFYKAFADLSGRFKYALRFWRV